MFDALLGRRRGGEPQAAGKRQRRADIAEELGGVSGSSLGTSLSSAPRRPGGAAATTRSSLLGGLATGSCSAETAAVPSARTAALSEWLAEGADGSSSPSAAPMLLRDNGDGTAAPEPLSPPAPVPLERAATSPPADGVHPPSAPAAPAEASDESAAAPTPARITSIEDLDKGWRFRFARAKDVWDVDEEGSGGVYWHSETGCCFEWDQVNGTLFQYAEGDGPAELPVRLPVWSTSYPDRHCWLWEQLPLPPTDAASAEGTGFEGRAGTAATAEAEVGVEATSCSDDRSSTSAAAASSSTASVSMPPPKGLPSKRGGAANSNAVDEMPPPAAPPSKKRSSCSAAAGPEDASETATDACASSRTDCNGGSSSGSGVSPSGSTCVPMPVAAPSSASSPSTPTAASEVPWNMVAGEEDDLGLVSSESTGLLGDEDEVVALPAAPTERAKPQACDLDLDIFGAPAEDAMEVGD